MIRWWLSLLLVCLVSPVQANLLRHATPEGEPGQVPKGMFHGVGYDPSTGPPGSGTLSVNYRYGRSSDGRPYTEIELINRASQAANYTLNLSTTRINLAEGQTYHLAAWLSTASLPRPLVMNLGYQLYLADGQYMSEMVDGDGGYQPGLGGAQQLNAEIVGGAPDKQTGRVPTSFLPRLAVYNIASGQVVRLRLSGIVLTSEQAVTGVQVQSLRHLPERVAPGGVLPLTIGLKGRPPKASGQVVSALSLVSGSGRRVLMGPGHQLVFAHGGRHQDVWEARIPRSTIPDRYALWYEVPSLGIKTRLGLIEVTAAAGMRIGYSFHRYPGASEASLGVIQARYQLARSLASDLVYGGQWWLGPDLYDWTGLMRWAQFHAHAGERKLVMTFSGSPRWASSEPQQRSAMGLPGYAAPPAQAYRSAYQRMVKETVMRLKGRLLATECWNEPNSTDFFTGTRTDLADLCKAVYLATKSVEPNVQVICPQADDPANLDFVYSARTSAGEPIHQFCDVVGAHLYNRLGADLQGQDYAQQRLQDGLDAMAAMSQKYGISKPLAVTEFGVSSCVTRASRAYPEVFGRMRSEDAGEALYRSLAGMREFGVTLVVLYSYDLLNKDPVCLPGGSFIRMTRVTRAGELTIDPVVVRRLNDAVMDFGWGAND